jgi:hypothetical protein
MTDTIMTGKRFVHFNGSIPFPSAEETFRQVCTKIPTKLRRIPDGEPQERQNFIYWQRVVFQKAPEVLNQYDESWNILPHAEYSPDQVKSSIDKLGSIETGYDTAALESYKVFRKLRDEGVIPAGVRFQVCLPSPIDMMAQISSPFKAAVEPLYEDALMRALARLEDEIPAEDLAIQWDISTPFALLEKVAHPHFEPFFDPIEEGVKQRVIRYGNAVQEGVELGYHLCYGDINGQHFCQPKDAGLLAEMASVIIEGVKRKVDWIQMPVPKNRDDEAFFEPLRNLELGGTELYLGLVHGLDEEGTLRRIQAASTVVKDFGVSTECGLGRAPKERVPSILDICSKA